MKKKIEKNIFIQNERKMERKVKEVMIEIWMENKYKKEKILEMYMKRVYMGQGDLGVDEEQRRYLKKQEKEVKMMEEEKIEGIMKENQRI